MLFKAKARAIYTKIKRCFICIVSGHHITKIYNVNWTGWVKIERCQRCDRHYLIDCTDGYYDKWIKLKRGRQKWSDLKKARRLRKALDSWKSLDEQF